MHFLTARLVPRCTLITGFIPYRSTIHSIQFFIERAHTTTTLSESLLFCIRNLSTDTLTLDYTYHAVGGLWSDLLWRAGLPAFLAIAASLPPRPQNALGSSLGLELAQSVDNALARIISSHQPYICIDIDKTMTIPPGKFCAIQRCYYNDQLFF